MIAWSESEIRRRFGAAARRERVRRGLSRADVQTTCGLHAVYVGSIERGEVSVTLLTARRLADGIGVALPTLLAGMTGPQQRAPRSRPETTSQRAVLASRALELIRKEPVHDLRVSAVAHRLGVPARTLQRALEAATGMSFTEHLIATRVDAGADLLLRHPEMTVREVAYAVHYLPCNFSQAFAQRYGDTPARWRVGRSTAGESQDQPSTSVRDRCRRRDRLRSSNSHPSSLPRS